jgi:NAD(P)-dependent dehydrogenase (short-subunit alcohol dehydrogenase family)
VIAGVRRDEDAKSIGAESDLIVPSRIDVTDLDSMQRVVATIDQQYSEGIDGLVNNAGLAVAGPVELVPLNDWRRQYEVNVLGIVSATKAFLPLLRRRRGRIINIGSAASSLALPMVGAYASSKFAVEGLSDSLRRELAMCGVKVVIVRPGQMATSIYSRAEQVAEMQLESARANCDHDYGPVLSRFQQLMHRSESSRGSPERVARVVAKALTVKRPRRRYHVGWDAHAANIIERYVPQAVVDWVITRKLRPLDPGS